MPAKIKNKNKLLSKPCFLDFFCCILFNGEISKELKISNVYVERKKCCVTFGCFYKLF